MDRSEPSSLTSGCARSCRAGGTASVCALASLAPRAGSHPRCCRRHRRRTPSVSHVSCLVLTSLPLLPPPCLQYAAGTRFRPELWEQNVAPAQQRSVPGLPQAALLPAALLLPSAMAEPGRADVMLHPSAPWLCFGKCGAGGGCTAAGPREPCAWVSSCGCRGQQLLCCVCLPWLQL